MRNGFTLIEVMIAVAVLALLCSLGLPSFTGALQRHRLAALAEALASDLALGRLQGASRGTPLHLVLHTGPAWCWALAERADCDCGQPLPCQVKRVLGADHPGLQLLQGQGQTLAHAALAAAGPVTVLANANGEALQVQLMPLGRARVCAPGEPLRGYARC